MALRRCVYGLLQITGFHERIVFSGARKVLAFSTVYIPLSAVIMWFHSANTLLDRAVLSY